MARPALAWWWLAGLLGLAGCAGRLEGEGEVDLFRFVLGGWLGWG